MSMQCMKAGFLCLLITLVGTLLGCGSKDVRIDAGPQDESSESVGQNHQGMPMFPVFGQEEQKAMLEASRIAAEAIRKGELPPVEQMEKLPPEQQEAIRRAVEAQASQ